MQQYSALRITDWLKCVLEYDVTICGSKNHQNSWSAALKITDCLECVLEYNVSICSFQIYWLVGVHASVWCLNTQIWQITILLECVAGLWYLNMWLRITDRLECVLEYNVSICSFQIHRLLGVCAAVWSLNMQLSELLSGWSVCWNNKHQCEWYQCLMAHHHQKGHTVPKQV